MKAMAVTKEKTSSERFSQVSFPIQYVTENGFSIIRQREVDGLENDTPRECRFLVRNERGWEREVTVHFAESLIEQIQRQRQTRLSETSVPGSFVPSSVSQHIYRKGATTLTEGN